MDMNLDEVLFGSSVGVEEPKEQEQPRGVPVMEPEPQGERKVFSLAQNMLQRIEDMDAYSWRRGEMGGMDWGFDQLNNAFEGLNPGVHLVGGQSNVGKSGFLMQLGLQIAQKNQEVNEQKNKKAHVIYFSLDDNTNELLPRFIAIDQKIPINTVRSPKKHQDQKEQMEKRQIGLDRLKEIVEYFTLFDANDGTSIEFIEKIALQYALELSRIDENYQVVLVIDNFHDITVDSIKFGSDTSGKYDHIADKLSSIATQLDCPILCSAEFRKLNGNRRPTLDDIRESVKIVYEAKAIMLCHNEVGLRGQQAQVYWMSPGNDVNQPVFEVDIRKNKFSSFKNRVFYEFHPSMSYFREVPPAGAQRYIQMISG